MRRNAPGPGLRNPWDRGIVGVHISTMLLLIVPVANVDYAMPGMLLIEVTGFAYTSKARLGTAGSMLATRSIAGVSVLVLSGFCR